MFNITVHHADKPGQDIVLPVVTHKDLSLQDLLDNIRAVMYYHLEDLPRKYIVTDMEFTK